MTVKRRHLWIGFPAFLVAHALFWTSFASITHGSIHVDMAQAWNWGKHAAFGYSSHPPLSGWLVGLWFQLFPRQDWAYFLLAQLNSALGLLGVWMIGRRWLTGPTLWTAVLLLCITPFYNIVATKFNADAVLLSTWPWATYFFIRSIESHRAIDGALLGLFAALAMLGKYYSALLLVSFFFAALIHPNARKFFRSKAPYAATVTCAMLMMPHIWWLIGHDFPTFAYAISKTQDPTAQVYWSGISAVVRATILFIPALIVTAWLLRPAQSTFMKRLISAVKSRQTLWLAILATGPFILTVLAVTLGHVKINWKYLIPNFYLLPAAAFHFTQLRIDPCRFKSFTRLSIPIAAMISVSAPAIALIGFKFDAENWADSTPAIAADVTQLWRQFSGVPLKNVTGRPPHALATSFYSPDAPDAFPPKQIETLSDSRIKREGLLVICRPQESWCIEAAKHVRSEGRLLNCPPNDNACIEEAKRVANPKTIVLQREYRTRLWMFEDGPRPMTVILVPPDPR